MCRSMSQLLSIMNLLLLPFACLYDVVTTVRNIMYNLKILPSETFDIPVICVGNLAVGGTGKTPHTEYVVRLLQDNGYKVAVLSRGYRRKTHGFLLANSQTTAADIGDEPWQIAQKFKDAVVAVDENRCRGIWQIMDGKVAGEVDVIVLDDAFQHRRVRAGLNILLTDSSRLYTSDYLLPAGRLRENWRGSRRAQIIVVTKLTADIGEGTALRYFDTLDIQDDQDIYFSRYRYGDPYNATASLPLSSLADYNVLLVTGIANPKPLYDELNKHTEVTTISFADHHDFTDKDCRKIQAVFDAMPADKPKIIVTTEKDMGRLLPKKLVNQDNIYALPIEVEILRNEKEVLNKQILDYVRENKRNG